MNRKRKFLLAIVTVFIITIGLIGLQYGFINNAASKSSDIAMENPTKKSQEHSEEANSTEIQTAIKDEHKTNETTSEGQEKKNESNSIHSSNETTKKSNLVEENVSFNSKKGTVNKDTNAISKNSKSNSTNTKEKVNEEKNSSIAVTAKDTEKPLQGNSKETVLESSKKQEGSKKPEQKENTEKPKQETPPKPAPKTVTFSIVGDAGTILSRTQINITDGDTVLDGLISVTKANGIPMSFRGGGASAYVEGINNLFELDKGQGSGWMYRVNGVFPNRGAGVIPLLDGDRVDWLYTLDMGKDIGAELKSFR